MALQEAENENDLNKMVMGLMKTYELSAGTVVLL